MLRLVLCCALWRCGAAAAALPASRVDVERCIMSSDAGTCASLPSVEECATIEPARDCLRASVPFRTPYTQIECCFRCCVHHWLNVSGLLSNIDFHVHYFEKHGFKVVPELNPPKGTMKNKPRKTEHVNPDIADYGLDPVANLIVHPHAFAVISHTRMHPVHGCQYVENSSSFPFTLSSLYQFDPNTVIQPKQSDRIGKPPSPFMQCVQYMRKSNSLILDIWRQAKLPPEPGVYDKVALLLANNVANLTAPYCSRGSYCEETRAPHDRIVERVIGVRAVSLWQATLTDELLPTLPRQQRLVLCCCMNIDAKHNGPSGGLRSLKLAHMQNYTEFDCPPVSATRGPHLGLPHTSDTQEHDIEKRVQRAVSKKYPIVKGKFDAHMPTLLLGSKFVFSPNGIGEQCYREYESMISGAYPLVDETWWYPRRQLLLQLPVVMIDDWAKVTPDFLNAKWAELEQKSFDISMLYLPYWYDKILTAANI